MRQSACKDNDFLPYVYAYIIEITYYWVSTIVPKTGTWRIVTGVNDLKWVSRLQHIVELQQARHTGFVLDGLVRRIPACTLEPDGLAAQLEGGLDVLLVAVADDCDVLRTEAHLVNRQLEDGRIGLADPHNG